MRISLLPKRKTKEARVEDYFIPNHELKTQRAFIMSQVPPDKGALKADFKRRHHRQGVFKRAAATCVVNVVNNQQFKNLLGLNNNNRNFDNDTEMQCKSCVLNSKSDKSNDFLQISTNSSFIENMMLKETRKADDTTSCDALLSKIEKFEKGKDAADEDTYVPKVESRCVLYFSDNTGDSQLYVNKKKKGGNTLSLPSVELTLSEIISPVDEVLSYGSAELSPSVKAELSLDSDGCSHPPPAFEVITWTSEDEQAPVDYVEDLSINSENIPPLPFDYTMNSQETQSLGFTSLREKEGTHETNGVSYEDTENKNCVGYFRNETSDLSSYQIINRCNSTPGIITFEGRTPFVTGLPGGVALDVHTETFRRVHNFSCYQHGKFENINREHSCDVETGQHENPISDDLPQRMDTFLAHTGCLSTDETIPTITISITEEHRSFVSRNLAHSNAISPPTEAGKFEDDYVKPCVLDQWPHTQPEMPSKIKVMPHEEDIVCRLVNASVEVLCGQANEDSIDLCETPGYLLNNDSSRQYREVIFQLTSDVLHEILGHPSWGKQCAKGLHHTPSFSALQSDKISFLKAAVRREIQKILNLDQSEQQMTEMLQKLCRYWHVKRDRVDFILIQELHREERSWLEYPKDQYFVKMHLTEEIFRLLLDDTIVALNHMQFGI